MGYVSTGRVEHERRKFSKGDIPRELLEYVYLNKALPDEWGLYTIFRPGDHVNIKKHIGFAPIFLEGKLLGLQLQFTGLHLLLSLERKDIAFSKNHQDFQHLMYRVRAIKQDRPRYVKSLTLVWE
jgi:hypothetical protein